MGILKSAKSSEKPTSSNAKRRSVQTDFANLKPLKPGGAVGFSAFRDNDASASAAKDRSKEANDNDAMDSDDDEGTNGKGIVNKIDEGETDDFRNSALSPEDAKRQGELAEGVKKIKVCLSCSASFLHVQPAGVFVHLVRFFSHGLLRTDLSATAQAPTFLRPARWKISPLPRQ